jgi:hypothetical protein
MSIRRRFLKRGLTCLVLFPHAGAAVWPLFGIHPVAAILCGLLAVALLLGVIASARGIRRFDAIDFLPLSLPRL